MKYYLAALAVLLVPDICHGNTCPDSVYIKITEPSHISLRSVMSGVLRSLSVELTRKGVVHIDRLEVDRNIDERKDEESVTGQQIETTLTQASGYLTLEIVDQLGTDYLGLSLISRNFKSEMKTYQARLPRRGLLDPDEWQKSAQVLVNRMCGAEDALPLISQPLTREEVGVRDVILSYVSRLPSLRHLPMGDPKLGMLEDKFRDSQRLLAIQPLNPAILRASVRMRLERGDYGQARQEITRLREVSPSSDAMSLSAWLHEISGEQALALQEYEESIASGGQHGHVWLRVARLRAVLGRSGVVRAYIEAFEFAGAVKAARVALMNIAQGDTSATSELGPVDRAGLDVARAVFTSAAVDSHAVSECAKALPGRVVSELGAASLLRQSFLLSKQQQQGRKALEQFQTIHERRPGLSEVQRGVAQLQLELGRCAEAVEFLIRNPWTGGQTDEWNTLLIKARECER